jgi:hypothetical protein
MGASDGMPMPVRPGPPLFGSIVAADMAVNSWS